jgi:hypothetical protein
MMENKNYQIYRRVKMKKGTIFIFLLSVMLILEGCNSIAKNSSNSLKITENDEETILEYLDTKTNDISSPREGKMYSAFDILGTDSDKIYIWMLKEECLKQGNEVKMTNGVSLPVVLYVETVEDKIEIKNHKFPEDGEQIGKSRRKLFPENVRNVMSNNSNERIIQLEEIIRNRAKEEIKINIQNANRVVISYGVSSYVMISSDKDIIKTLSDSFNNLSFKPTENKMDLITMFNIIFSTDGKQSVAINVDKNAVFRLNGEKQCLKIASGTFNNKIIKDIYEKR